MAALNPILAPDLRDAKRLVVKIGSALLVDRKLGLKQDWLSALALDVAVRSGKIKKGDTLMLEGVGGGFTWGAVLLDY